MGDPPNPSQPWLWALRLALLAALLAALVLVRGRPAYRPTTAFLAWVGLAHVVRPLLQTFILAPARAAHGVPYVGVARAWYHLDQALFVSWPIGITALAIHTFTGRRVWPVAAAYVAIVAGLALGYPTVRRELLQSVYLAITLAALAVSFGAMVIWWRRKPAQPAYPPQIAASLFVIMEAGAIVGPYAAGMIDVNWPIAQGLYTGLYGALFALEVAWARPR